MREVKNMCLSSLWKISAPKERIIALVEKMDSDEDGFISFGEVRDLLKRYAKAIKRSARFKRR